MDDEIELLEPLPPQPQMHGTAAAEAPVASPIELKQKRQAWNKGKGYISTKLKAAIQHVADGMTITDAAAKAGMSRWGVSEALQRPHVIALLEGSVRSSLAAAAARAAKRLDHLIDGARSEYVQLEASKAVLDRAGYAQQTTAQLGGDIVIEINL